MDTPQTPVRRAVAAAVPEARQLDGDSEFAAEFGRECWRRGIRLFVVPPRSPKLNGHVKRARLTDTQEFYEVTEIEWTVEALRRRLRRTQHRFLRNLAPAG